MQADGSQISSRYSVREMLDLNNAYHLQRLQRIRSTSYPYIEQMKIFELRDTPNRNVFYYDADKYDGNYREQIEEYLVKSIDALLQSQTRSYCIAYLHSSFIEFLIFRRIMEKWPEHFYARMRKVYIVGATVMVRIIESLSFGTFSRLLQEKLLNLDNLKQLQDADRELLQTLNEETFESLAERDSIRFKGIKGNPLYGKQLQQYSLHEGKYPMLVLRLLHRLLRDESGLRDQGIFRKSCDSDELHRLEERLAEENAENPLGECDISVVCSCLKKVFNNLYVPLFGYEAYEQILQARVEGSSETQLLRRVIAKMLEPNRRTMILMITFLLDCVVRHESENKMGSYNLAVIFGPCFFRSRQLELADLLNSGKFSRVIYLLLGGFETVFTSEEIVESRKILQELKKSSFLV